MKGFSNVVAGVSAIILMTCSNTPITHESVKSEATIYDMIVEQDGSSWPKYQMANCGLTKLVFDPAPRLVFLNDTAHLDGIGAIAEW